MLFAGTTFAAALAVGSAASAQTARAQQQAPAAPGGRKPNIIMIMGDDVGMWNISAYNRGMMGGRTPNLDRIAAEGAVFTDYYAQQSCTAGRAAFILGQTPFRTGLLKVGLPAAKQGLQDKDPTIAELLKPLGYATAQIGKNHLGDRNEYLPTVHGFDEFYGILYHLKCHGRALRPAISEGGRVSGKIRSAQHRGYKVQRHRRSHNRPALGQGRKAGGRQWRAPAAAPKHGSESEVQHGGCRRRIGAPLARFH
jgi:arylsulfatase A-like enzyme